MGNQGSALGDGDENDAAASRLAHFDHSYKAFLHTTHGPMMSTFGEMKGENKEVQLTCQSDSFEILVDALASADRKKVAISYTEVAEVGWDHALCEVKLVMKRPETEDSFVILHVPTSVELEHELKLRYTNISSTRQGAKIPPFHYVGMFAGSTKPKPFQRKRPNISRIPAGKLPPLAQMREMAEKRHQGSYMPCPPGSSRRIELAVQHIFEGHNTFPVTHVRGNSEYTNRWTTESVFLVTESKMVFLPRGINGPDMEIQFDQLSDWTVEDRETRIDKDVSGIFFHFVDQAPKKDDLYLGFKHIRDVKHTMEFFWNKYQVANGRSVKLGSTHGRPLETIHTLSGEVPAPEAPQGQIDIVDSDGLVVRAGQMVKTGHRTSIVASKKGAVSGVQRRASLGFSLSSEPQPLPHETKVKYHWRSIVKHQGWLLKKGGVGVGPTKQWIKRYFVLYSTSQGHFLVYYSDLLECPMYTTEHVQRNVVDLAKTTFIRPGSNKQESSDTPPHSFDIQTTEREWTLCAETQENAYKCLQMLTRAVDEDVAIIPDEDIEFKVKAKVDPLGVFNAMDYSTSVMVSANAVCVVAPDPPGSFNLRQQCFWVYTDFYKWSLLSQNGKLALLVNVFSDATFSKRMEFIFRTKEAVRLATAIEFFIEKFMTAMHIQLELLEDGMDEAAEEHHKMKHAAAEDWEEDAPHQQHQTQEGDLLGFDTDDSPRASAPPAPPATNANDLDFFGESAPPPPPDANMNQFNAFNDDSFGFGNSQGEKSQTVQLTDAQVAQHKAWLQAATLSGVGPLYDDGILQIACKLEVRGSQARLTLFFRNKSGDANITELATEMNDPAGLLRKQLGSLAANINPLGQTDQQIMVECMTPVSPGPTLTVSYRASDNRLRNNTFNLPVTVMSFNEPLALNFADFNSRWNMLVGPGQEGVEEFRPSHTVDKDSVAKALSSALKFHRVSDGLPMGSDNVVYGSASLRTGTVKENSGEKITLGCLIKIEINAQSNVLRVTSRTVLPAATTATIQTAKTLLS